MEEAPKKNGEWLEWCLYKFVDIYCILVCETLLLLHHLAREKQNFFFLKANKKAVNYL